MNKLLSCRFNMDTDRVEARFADGSTLAIDCIAIEDEYGNTPAQRAELGLLYNKPLEYAQLMLGGKIEHYLSLGCDHGRLEDQHYEIQKTTPKISFRYGLVAVFFIIQKMQVPFASLFGMFGSALQIL